MKALDLPIPAQNTLTRTARATGAWYLGLAVSGLLGMMLIRPRFFVDGDPAATLANLVAHQQLARTGVAVDLAVVITQALAAVWFYRLFRGADRPAAGAIAAFGLVNATLILAGAAATATAAQLARDPFGDAAAAVQVLYLVDENLWRVAGLFFGLWLIPMGRCVLVSGWMPRLLGRILVVGGWGYVASAFVASLIPDGEALASALTLPATVGELWMVGYLLVRGVRQQVDRDTADGSAEGPAGDRSAAERAALVR